MTSPLSFVWVTLDVADDPRLPNVGDVWFKPAVAGAFTVPLVDGKLRALLPLGPVDIRVMIGPWFQVVRSSIVAGLGDSVPLFTLTGRP